jgi:hypothetical protein
MGVSVIGHGQVLLLSIAKWHDFLKCLLLMVYDSDRQAPPDLLNLLPEEQIWIQTDGRCTIYQYWHSYVEKPMCQQAEDLLYPKDTSRGIRTYL